MCKSCAYSANQISITCILFFFVFEVGWSSYRPANSITALKANIGLYGDLVVFKMKKHKLSKFVELCNVQNRSTSRTTDCFCNDSRSLEIIGVKWRLLAIRNKTLLFRLNKHHCLVGTAARRELMKCRHDWMWRSKSRLDLKLEPQTTHSNWRLQHTNRPTEWRFFACRW